MIRAIAWFARNHVAANLLMLLLVVGGIVTLPTLRQEMLPDISRLRAASVCGFITR